jgi:hypothetical protein
VAETLFYLFSGDKMKKCTHCKEIKPYSAFGKSKAYKDGYANICRKCNYDKNGREWHLKKTYGISTEDFNFLREKQNYSCACCGKHENEISRKRLYIDHNHQTGKVRGLLCHSCNVSLGLMKEDIDSIASLIAYLKEHNE